MNPFSIKVFANRIDPATVTLMQNYALQYYGEHNITLTIDIEQSTVNGYESVYTQVRSGYWEWILTGAPALVQINETYDITMFIFDQNEWQTPPGSPFPLQTDTPSSDTVLFNGKPFINLGIYTPLLNSAEITFCHEIIHALRMIAQARGFAITDTMDVMIVDGVVQLYYLNNDPTNVNSNFTNMLEQFFSTGFLTENKQ